MARIFELKQANEKERAALREQIEEVSGDLISMLLVSDPLELDLQQVDACVAKLRIFVDDYKALVQP